MSGTQLAAPRAVLPPLRSRAAGSSGGAVTTVVLDRDGVINENRVDHVKDWSEFHFLPGALPAIARLTQAGVRIFVFTNQAVVNRGMVPRATVEQVNRRMAEVVEQHGGRIEAVAYCPHRPDERCGCRKPQPGLLLDLARQHTIALNECVVIGDALADIKAGQAAGCETILVLTGRGGDQLALAPTTGTTGFAVAADLSAATDLLMRRVGATAPMNGGVN